MRTWKDAESFYKARFIAGAKTEKMSGSPRETLSEAKTTNGTTFLLMLSTKKHIANLAPERAYTEAARDVGWILKGVIADDQRIFNTRIAEEVRHYQWVP